MHSWHDVRHSRSLNTDALLRASHCHHPAVALHARADGFSFVDLAQDDDRPKTYYALKRILCQTTDQLSSVHMELARWYRRSSSSGLLLLANVVPDCSPSAEACMLFSALHASIELDSDDQAVEAVVDQWHDWLPTLLNPSMDDDSSSSSMTSVSTSSAASSKKRHQRPETHFFCLLLDPTQASTWHRSTVCFFLVSSQPPASNP